MWLWTPEKLKEKCESETMCNMYDIFVRKWFITPAERKIKYIWKQFTKNER